MASDAVFPHSQLQHLVAEQLRTEIVEGRLKPGQWLRQRQLAEQLNVSQMPVREALKELAGEGLVEHIPYRGMRVVGFAPDDVADLYTHRSLLEGMAARAACPHLSTEDLETLKNLQMLMVERMAPEHLAEYRKLNRLFHETIIKASRRAYLIRTLLQMWDAFPTMLWSNFALTAAHSLPNRDMNDIDEHAAILAALECGDAEAAERSMRDHIETAGRDLVAVLTSKDS